MCHYWGEIPTMTGIKYTLKHLILLSKSGMITLGQNCSFSVYCVQVAKKYGYPTCHTSVIKSDSVRMDLILNADFSLIQGTYKDDCACEHNLDNNAMAV